MNKTAMLILFIILIASGFFISNIIFQEKEKITIKDIVSNTSKYMGQEVTVRGKAIQHSANNWIKLEDKGYSIFARHDMMNEYFRYGEKYQAKGTIKEGDVPFETGKKIYLDIKNKEDIIRNNSLGWI